MSGAFFSVAGLLYLGLGMGLGAPGAPLGWLGASLCLVGLAYLLRRPALLGKRSDGSFSRPLLPLTLPFLALSWLGWQLRRRRAEACWGEVAPGLFLGRRPREEELPPQIDLVVDLTSELTAALADGRAYLCLPTLDGTAPAPEALRTAVLEACRFEGRIYVHCAAGRGRSAAFMACLLLARGLACTADEAVARMRRARPTVALTREQERGVRAFAAERLEAGEA